MKTLLYITIVLGVFVAGFMLVSELKLQEEFEYNNQVAYAVQELRNEKSLRKIAMGGNLRLSAKYKATQIEKTCTWSHFIEGEKKFTKLIKQTGQDFNVAGEVLARGYKNPVNIVKGWENSPSHAKIVLGDYKKFGVYSWRSECDGKVYVVAHFIK